MLLTPGRLTLLVSRSKFQMVTTKECENSNRAEYLPHENFY
jgi:hypothetical protein